MQVQTNLLVIFRDFSIKSSVSIEKPKVFGWDVDLTDTGKGVFARTENLLKRI
jgi:hypothetical protein